MSKDKIFSKQWHQHREYIERVFYDCWDKSVFTSEVKENIERARMLIEESIDLIENDY